MLTAAHRADLATFETKTVEFSAFMAEHAEKHTPETLGQARTRRDELVSLKAKIEGHVAAAGMSAEASTFDAFLNEPGTGMKHLGSARTGQDVRDEKKGLIYSQGAGLFGAKVWDGISDPDYAKAFTEYLRKGEKSSNGALKLLEVGLDPQGGYLAPPEQLQRLIERKPTPTRLAGMVPQIMDRGDAAILPRVNYQGASADDANGQIYTTGFRVTNTEEVPSSDIQANVNDLNLFGSVRVDNYTHMIEGVMTNNQVEDAAFDVMGWYEGKLGQTVEIFRDDLIINGTGVQQATGILPYAAAAGQVVPLSTINTLSAGLIKGDDVINLAYDVSEQYEDELKFLFNKTAIFKYLRLLKDTSNRYLFGQGYNDSGLSNGKPKDLVGYPFVFSALMRQALTAGAVTTGQTPIVFGDFKGYTQTMRLGFSVQVCRELLARRNQVLLVGRIRIGGMPLEPWRLRVLKVA
jgi:HK97 family phage major capsid protein